MPYRLYAGTGGVNFYLLKNENGCFLIDTGFSLSRGKLKTMLEKADCPPDGLKLIIITHGDVDHTGNCVYLREKYGVKIAMHPAEENAASKVQMSANRGKKSPWYMRTLMALFARLLTRPFKPDIQLNDGDDLSIYGLDARIIHTPGHTLGSVSIFTGDGDLFCGDFLKGTGRVGVNTLVDDTAAMEASFTKIRNLSIKQIYPGHGRPFNLEELLRNHG